MNFLHQINISQEKQLNDRYRRAAISNKNKLWPNATIPYLFSSNISAKTKQNVLSAMSHWESRTCVRFHRRVNEKDFVLIVGEGDCGCCSLVGRVGDVQLITLSDYCAMFGVAVHELGHAIGFWHEHSRFNFVKPFFIVR